MRRKSNHIVVRETEWIYNANKVNDPDKRTIPSEDFKSLRGFILDNGDQADAALSLFRRQGKEVIRFNNYVGVIEIKTGFTIEVLPKIYSIADVNEQRRIFLGMLRYLKNSPFRTISEAHLRTQRFPVLEIFISTFLAEIDILFKKGLKRAYKEKEENLECAKGRIDFSRQISHNIVHKERFYVHYDEFSLDIPQNRILKNTFHYLLYRSRVYENKRRLNQYLQIWYSIPYSNNLESDLQRIDGHSRLYSHYDRPLQWARVFLVGESFTNFRGKSINTALLFPMEKIFEDYVTAMFRKYFPENGLTIRTQDKRKHLVDSHNGKPKFRLVPDIVIEKDSHPVAVLDTKWKAINQDQPEKNYCISQGDLYQLFAYGSKYEGNPKLFLVYPASETFNISLEPFYYTMNELNLRAVPFWLSRKQDDLKRFFRFMEATIRD
ncbi:MAG: McrC family protein [Bacteroidota bacterium]